MKMYPAFAAVCLLSLLLWAIAPTPGRAGERPTIAVHGTEEPEGTEYRRPLQVRGDHNYPPYEYLNDRGRPDGFNVDIMRALAEAMGMDIGISLGPWDEVRAQLEKGEIDALIGMFQTKERDKTFDFSIPHFIASYAVFVRQDSAIASLDDARGKRIIVQLSDLGHDYLKENNITADIIVKKDWSEVLKSLAGGEGDCAIVSRLQGTRLIGELGIAGIKAVGSPIIQRKYCLAVSEGNNALLAKLNEGLSIIKDTGKYDEIYDKWFGVYEEQSVDPGKIFQYLIWIVLPLVVMATAGFIWSWMLRKQVNRRTKDLNNELHERRRAEEELRLRENQLQKIFEILPIGLWFADREGTLLRGNPMGMKIWGADPEVPISAYPALKAWRLPSREPVKVDEWALAKTIKSGVTIVDELLEIEAFDGRKKTILCYTTPVLNDHGRTDGAIVVNLDISDRKILEQKLLQAQKMESIGRLAGGVAHDFNNMLSVILGHTELALDTVGPDQDLFGYLQNIREAGQRSADLTRQLLAFARRQTVAPQMLDLNATLSGMLKMLRRLIGEDIDLVWRPGENLGLVKIDPSQIDQILVNLCINARDAIGDTGKVTIETGTATFDEPFCAGHEGFVPGEYVLLVVGDDGCGIDAGILPYLFEPFFTTKETGKGTGLGLATIYGIVKQNHGFINVYSEPGQGTVFKIYLPRHIATAAGPVRNDAAEPVSSGVETILLVEDEPMILKMAKIMLEQLGYTVLPAATPAEAIGLARAHAGEIHLLFTDVVMPEMNGQDLARKVLALYPNMKSLFMSGYTANVIAHHGVLDRGVHFIPKPFTVVDLAKRMREVLEAGAETASVGDSSVGD